MDFKKVLNINHLFIPIFLLIFSDSTSFLQGRTQFLLIAVFLGAIFYVRQLKLDWGLVYLVSLWILINIVSATLINPNTTFSLVTVFSRLMLILIVYFIVKLSGKHFFDKLNKHIFYLTIIGVVLFAVQQVFPSLLFALGKFFRPFTEPEMAAAGSWYSYFYMFNTWHFERNCGFMWEPGAFAGVLVLMITYHFSRNDFKIDKYIIVYTIGLISSMSTAGFLAMAVIFFAFYLKQRKNSLLLILIFPLVVYFSISFYNNSELLSGKIDRYMKLGSDTWGVQDDGVYRTSRVGYAIIIFDESIHWPFGHGVINSSEFKLKKYGEIFGPGVLSDILHQWGWIGLIATIWFIFRFYSRHVDRKMSWIFTVAVGIMLFSNPYTFFMIIFAVVFYEICIPRDELVELKD